jgi:hypothetical protein
MRPAARRASALFLAPAFAVVLSACTNHDAVLGVHVITPPQGVVSFARDVNPIFTSLSRGGCTQSGCHGGSIISANLNLEKVFDPTVGAVDVFSCEAATFKRIAPFDSTNSYLVHKLEGTLTGLPCSSCNTGTLGVVTNCGSMMPFGSQQGLAASDIEIIHDWIDQGAPNN